MQFHIVAWAGCRQCCSTRAVQEGSRKAHGQYLWAVKAEPVCVHGYWKRFLCSSTVHLPEAAARGRMPNSVSPELAQPSFLPCVFPAGTTESLQQLPPGSRSWCGGTVAGCEAEPSSRVLQHGRLQEACVSLACAAPAEKVPGQAFRAGVRNGTRFLLGWGNEIK